jgi:hypothetical protein
MFTQFTCIQSNQEIHDKYKHLCASVAGSVLVAMLFTIMIRSLYYGGKIKLIEWDFATITAGDYTVELPIPEVAYIEWYDNEYKKAGGDADEGIAPAMSLKTQLKSLIEQSLTAELVDDGQVKPAHTGTESSEALAEIKVADIVFSFNNWKLINALRQRGVHIAS